MADETFTKADVEKAVADAVAKVQEKIDELSSKNAGLLDDLKKAQREARAAKDIKPEDLAAAEDRAEKAEAALAEANKALKSATSEKDKAVAALETEQGFTKRLLIQDGVKSALIANGVKDEDFLETLSVRFAKDAEVSINGDNRTAKIGDKALGDFIKEWAGSDAGKKFVAAAANSGGGASGSNGKESGGKKIAASEFNALGPKERAAKFAEGYTVDDQA